MRISDFFLSILVLIMCSLTFSMTHANECRNGFFWSNYHERCVHQYYMSCIQAANDVKASENDREIYEELSDIYQTKSCTLIEEELMKEPSLILDCEKISDLSSLYPLPKLRSVSLANVQHLKNLEFLTGSQLGSLALENYSESLDLSAVSQIDGLLAVHFHGGEKAPLPRDIPLSVRYFEIIDVKDGRGLYEFLLASRNYKRIYFGEGSYHISHDSDDQDQ